MAGEQAQADGLTIAASRGQHCNRHGVELKTMAGARESSTCLFTSLMLCFFCLAEVSVRIRSRELMTVQHITLPLSETIADRARQAASVLQKPVEEALAAMLAAALPDLDDVPPAMRTDLARMSWMSDEALWDVATSVMPPGKQEQLRYLAEIPRQRLLTRTEEETLDAHCQEYGKLTLCEARAYALLSMRGGRLLLEPQRRPYTGA